MDILEVTKEKLIAKYSEWIKVEDDECKWTIEDFSYIDGIDKGKIKPHCWKCVSVNKCWFKNEKEKKPESALKKDRLLDSILEQGGLYHPNCHCREIGIQKPGLGNIELITTKGKVEYLFTKKFNEVIKPMGYSLDDKNEIIKLYEKLAKEAFSSGNYVIRTHNEFGVAITLYYQFPGKNEKIGRYYNIKSGWIIFPNGKIKANTIMGGFVE